MTSLSKESIIRKIAALRERTINNGCSEAEALSAARIIANLLAQHGMSMSDIEIRDSSCSRETISTFDHESTEIRFCITAIAQFTDCKAWRHYDKLIGVQYNFFGLPEDVRTAKWLYDIVSSAMGIELAGFRIYLKSNKTRATKKKTSSFLAGMSSKVGIRLVEMKREQDALNKTTTGRDLVLVKSDTVDRQFADLGINLSHRRTKKSAHDLNAFKSGDRAGGRVSFNQKVTGNSGLLT